MYVGYMGNIIFAVSSRYTVTPAEVERSGSARWATHDILMQKPVSQFIGPGLEQVSFKIFLLSSHGINPSEELNKLRVMRDTGAVFPVIIGGKPITQNYWYIDSISEGDRKYSSFGHLISVTASVTLKEYDDSNYQEEKSMIEKYGKAYNVASVLLGGL